MAKKKPKNKRSPEFRQGVRQYASAMLGAVSANNKGSFWPMPPDNEKRNMVVGILRWSILAMEIEEHLCMMEEDVEQRQAIQSEIDEEAA